MKKSYSHICFSCVFFLCLLGLCQGCRSTTTTTRPTKSEKQHSSPLSYEQQRLFDELYLSAVNCKLKKQYDAQYDLLQAALKIHPHAPEALYDFALLTDQLGGAFDTIQEKVCDSLLALAVTYAPDNKIYKATLADRLINEAKYEQGAKYYEEIIAREPDERLLATLINIYQNIGQHQKALEKLDKLEELTGKSEETTMLKFASYEALHDDENAYRSIEDLCAENPSELKYRVFLGDLFMQNHHPQQALMVYKDVLTADPENPYAQLSLLAYYHHTKNDSLYNNYLREVVLNPRTQNEARIETLTGYINVCNQRGDSLAPIPLFKEALNMPQADRLLAELCAYYLTSVHMPTDSLAPVMHKILDVEPDNEKARLQLLQIAIRQQDLPTIIQLCREGQNFYPQNPVYYFYDAASELQLDHKKKALEIVKNATQNINKEQDRETTSDLYGMLGDLLYEAHEYPAAFEAYEKAITYNGANLLVLNNYAYFLSLHKKDLDKAATYSRITVDKEPNNVTFLDTYAWILYLQKEYDKARIYIEQAIHQKDAEAESAVIYDHAGDIFYRCGKHKEAMKWWKKALQTYPDKTLQLQLKRKIRRGRI